MNRWLVYDTATGDVIRSQTSPSGKQAPATREGRGAIQVLPELPVARYFIDVDGPEPIIRIRDPRPSAEHQWDRELREWTLNLGLRKAAQWELVKAARGEAERAGVEVGGVRFDTDPISQQRITGACLLAQVDPTASWEWTAADNSAVQLDATQMMQLGMAVAAHVAACHAQGRALRAQIDAATTAEEIDAITFPEPAGGT